MSNSPHQLPASHDQEVPVKLEQQEYISQQSYSSCSDVKREGFKCGVCGEWLLNEVHFLEHTQSYYGRPAHSGGTGSSVKCGGFQCGVCGRYFGCKEELFDHFPSRLTLLDSVGTGITTNIKVVGNCNTNVYQENNFDFATPDEIKDHVQPLPFPTFSENRAVALSAVAEIIKDDLDDHEDLDDHAEIIKDELGDHEDHQTSLALSLHAVPDTSKLSFSDGTHDAVETQLRNTNCANITSEKQCNNRDYFTTKRSSLVGYTRIQTPQNRTSTKKFKCEICDYSSSRKSSVVKHNKIHTREKPFKCESCSYATAHRAHLTRHARLHTGELPYSCLHCDYRCNVKQQLKLHFYKHTGVRPFKCGSCSYSTACKSSLTVHTRTCTHGRDQRSPLLSVGNAVIQLAIKDT